MSNLGAYNERIEESDSNTIETSTSSSANILDFERIEESNSNIVETSTSSPDIETSTSSPAIKTSTPSIADVQNLSYVASKGRPLKQRYLSSIEKKQKCGVSSSRGAYKYSLCGQIGLP
ncbi:hypothetical protein C2G38_2260616 [Gigaspora rosea]|uniref:Uncharacterized protein n=1 Tax=Gigaspora rosea TaxID=44941 RepID=A0A397W0L2_9GLOM|nr:hypothetical protein C2G38_2260616 [Gigaspora rosea]